MKVACSCLSVMVTRKSFSRYCCIRHDDISGIQKRSIYTVFSTYSRLVIFTPSRFVCLFKSSFSMEVLRYGNQSLRTLQPPVPRKTRIYIYSGSSEARVLSSEYPEISFAIQEETMINLFGEITGTGAAAQAWQIWVKGSDRLGNVRWLHGAPPIIWVQTSTA